MSALTQTQEVQQRLAEYLALPASYPLIVPVSDAARNTLNLQAAKARARRFDDAASVTGYGELS